MAAERLAGLREQEDYINDENTWWNKLKAMSPEDMKMLPQGFMRKYGSYITNMQRYDRDWHLDENKNAFDYFS